MKRVGAFILLSLLVIAILGPLLSPYSYHEMNLPLKNSPPSSSHWFGTDDLGRDLFTRVCYGTGISLFVGVSAGLINLAIGVFWGGIAGMVGGRTDEILMRIADILYSLPYLLVVILLTVFMGPGLFTLIIALTVIGWITMARIVRGQVLQLKEQEYALAAEAMGAGTFYIFTRHLLPNASKPIVTTLMLTIPSAIFSEALLSFLGLGIQAPMASLGTMANEGLPAMQYYPWRLFVPSVVITLTIFGFHMLHGQLLLPKGRSL